MNWPGLCLSTRSRAWAVLSCLQWSFCWEALREPTKPGRCGSRGCAVAEAMLAASRLTRRFGGLVAVDAVSIELRSGQIHAVIGTNGAGKSTLINLLAGELTPTSGAISLRGTPVKHARP